MEIKLTEDKKRRDSLRTKTQEEIKAVEDKINSSTKLPEDRKAQSLISYHKKVSSFEMAKKISQATQMVDEYKFNADTKQSEKTGNKVEKYIKFTYKGPKWDVNLQTLKGNQSKDAERAKRDWELQMKTGHWSTDFSETTDNNKYKQKETVVVHTISCYKEGIGGLKFRFMFSKDPAENEIFKLEDHQYTPFEKAQISKGIISNPKCDLKDSRALKNITYLLNTTDRANERDRNSMLTYLIDNATNFVNFGKDNQGYSMSISYEKIKPMIDIEKVVDASTIERNPYYRFVKRQELIRKQKEAEWKEKGAVDFAKLDAVANLYDDDIENDISFGEPEEPLNNDSAVSATDYADYEDEMNNAI